MPPTRRDIAHLSPGKLAEVGPRSGACQMIQQVPLRTAVAPLPSALVDLPGSSQALAKTPRGVTNRNSAGVVGQPQQHNRPWGQGEPGAVEAILSSMKYRKKPARKTGKKKKYKLRIKVC